MSAGKLAAPAKPRHRGYPDQFNGVIPSRAVTPPSRDAAIVITRIGLRPGDNTDILEALGLIPTQASRVPNNPPTFCAQCSWQSTKPKNPPLALKLHMQAKHQARSW